MNKQLINLLKECENPREIELVISGAMAQGLSIEEANLYLGVAFSIDQGHRQRAIGLLDLVEAGRVAQVVLGFANEEDDFFEDEYCCFGFDGVEII